MESQCLVMGSIETMLDCGYMLGHRLGPSPRGRSNRLNAVDSERAKVSMFALRYDQSGLIVLKTIAHARSFSNSWLRTWIHDDSTDGQLRTRRVARYSQR